MKLQDAIKTLVKQFGDSIVSEVRLANLLADYNAYGDYPAMQQVFRDGLKAGYGKKLLDAYMSNPKDAVDKSEIFVKEFSKKSNFKEDLISYGFDCILFGLGCLLSVNEPLSKGYDPYSNVNGNILDNLADQLSSYQKQYMDLLDRLITKPKDILRDAAGYYSTEARNKLYTIEAKIFAIQQQLGKFDLEWCEKQRESKLAYYKKQKSDAVNTQLDTLKNKYQNILTSSIIIPRKLFVKRSGYYTEDTLKELSVIEADIIQAYYNKGEQYDDWCKKVMAKQLAKHKVDSSSVALQLFGKIGIPAALFFGASGTGISYMTSSDSIEQFEAKIQQGEQIASQGNYGKALQLFSEAKNGYNASFLPSHYQSIAEEHINANVDKVVEECTSLMGQKKLVAASALLKSLPQKVVAENNVNIEKVKTAQNLLDTEIADGLENLITNISQNKGHLDAESQKLLDELLTINSNDYWLNFIKNREK